MRINKKELPILSALFANRCNDTAVWLCGVKDCGHELGKVAKKGESRVVLAPEMVRRSDGVWIKGKRHPLRAGRAWMKADSEARGETPDFMTPAQAEAKQLEAMIERTGRTLSYSVLKVENLPAIIQCPCSKCRRLSKISSVRGVIS